MKAVAIALFCSMLCIPLAHASDAGREADCNAVVPMSAMGACVNQNYENAEHALNETYRALLTQLAPKDRSKFQAAERAWVTYRDAECSVRTRMYGGNMAALNYTGCRDQMTRTRIQEMRDDLNSQG